MVCYVGGPAAPEPVLRMINTTNMVLEWNPPFTWPYTMISHYKISVNNSVENWNYTAYATTSLQLTSLLQGECEEYTFSVLGNNGLSDGKWGRVTGGFPIGKWKLGVCSKYLKWSFEVWFWGFLNRH